jgi:hypothetical protein
MSKYNFKRIILCAGHGGGDSGAVNGVYREADQTIKIVDKVNLKLNNIGTSTLVVPHSLDYILSTNWTNSSSKDEDLLIEVHRDSALNVDENESSTRLGVYGVGDSAYSMELANTLGAIFKRKSKNNNSWVRPDTVIGGLYLIRNVKPTALLVEMGFMQGRNDDDHLEWLAQILFESIVELIGFELKNQTQIIMNDNTTIDKYYPARKSIEVQGWIYEERRKVINTAITIQDINYICRELGWLAQNWVKNEDIIKDNLKTISDLQNKLKDKQPMTTIPSVLQNTPENTTMDVQLDFKMILYKFLEKLNSRKFWVTILGLLVPIINSKFNLNLDQMQILQLLGFAGVYVVSQARVDISQSN